MERELAATLPPFAVGAHCTASCDYSPLQNMAPLLLQGRPGKRIICFWCPWFL